MDSLTALYFAPQLFAEHGVPGSGRKMHGRNGEDLVVPVPRGTEIFNAETGELMADITLDGQSVLIARGGGGGLGNVHFKSSTHQAPTEHTPGATGDEFRLRLELKIIADAGLIGFPNAGKSSLLRAVSKAHPQVAGYPFTTLNPIVGTVEYDDFSRLSVADIPGIIEGASSGVGLGLRFLKHISRSRLLVYVVDMAGVDNREPWSDYNTLCREISQYDVTMLERPSLVLANKMDLPSARDNLEHFIQETGVNPLCLSTLEPASRGVSEFKATLKDILNPRPRGSWEADASTTETQINGFCATAQQSNTAVCITKEALRKAPFLELPNARN